MGLRSKLKRVRNIARAVVAPHTLVTDRLKGDPRSLFYGDPIEVTPEVAGEAVGRQEPVEDTVPAAVVQSADESRAAERLAAYESMSMSDRAQVTLLPPLACWNAFVVINPMIGKVQATSLDYMLLKTLNDYPYEGKTFMGGAVVGDTCSVVIDSASINETTGIAGGYIAIPFFRFTIASSTLTGQVGGQITISVSGVNSEGKSIDTLLNYPYSFQRLSTTEAVVGVYIPTVVVATRTLPFLPIAGDTGGTPAAGSTPASPTNPKVFTITFKGVTATDQVSVTVPGYASAELREIAKMYGLPSGDVR